MKNSLVDTISGLRSVANENVLIPKPKYSLFKKSLSYSWANIWNNNKKKSTSLYMSVSKLCKAWMKRDYIQMWFKKWIRACSELLLNLFLTVGQWLKCINHECEDIDELSNKSLPARIYFDSNMHKDWKYERFLKIVYRFRNLEHSIRISRKYLLDRNAYFYVRF